VLQSVPDERTVPNRAASGPRQHEHHHGCLCPNLRVLGEIPGGGAEAPGEDPPGLVQGELRVEIREQVVHQGAFIEEVNAGEYPSLMATVRNFGQVDLWGADLGATLIVNDAWQFGLSGSLVSNDAFCVGEDRELHMDRCDEDVGDGRIIALNAPARKLAARLNYRDDGRGLHGELLVRHMTGHPVNNPAFSAADCDGPGDAQGRGDCVAPHLLFDLTLGYRFGATGLSAQLAMQNVLGAPYRSFIGVSEIGRLTMLRLRYDF